ncbi:uncharacterized protein LOC124120751 [Haliotis rufescens]|uniref:uncharacterized protein LOC124120751 n=1 Tax=Haliotis rufescens TaxID=6454 RepID=UPI00201F9B75|nr:uncharacterized protein LOC124120751 [Haliotis rufescens]
MAIYRNSVLIPGKESSEMDDVSRGTQNAQTWPSNDPFLPILKQNDDSFRRIRDSFINTGLTVRYDKTSLHQESKGLLRHRLETTFKNQGDTTGLLYMTNSLSELLNIDTVSDAKIPSDLMFEALYVSSSQAVTLLCVVKHKHENEGEKLKYILQLTRKVTMRIRQFTDEHISCMYGLLDDDDLASVDTFHRDLMSMEKKARAYNNLFSLKMTQDKCENMLNAFIIAVGTRPLVPGEKDDVELWLHTEEQFYERIETIERMQDRSEEKSIELEHLGCQVSSQITLDKCEKASNATNVAFGTRQPVPGGKDDEKLWIPQTIKGMQDRSEEEIIQQKKSCQQLSRTFMTGDTNVGDIAGNMKPRLSQREENRGRKYPRSEVEMVNALREETSRKLQQVRDVNFQIQEYVPVLKAHTSLQTAPLDIVKVETTYSATQRM